MTTTTFDVSYGTRAVPLRLPYLSVRRRPAASAAASDAVRAAVADPGARADRGPRADRARATARALAARDAAVDRALAARAGIGV